MTAISYLIQLCAQVIEFMKRLFTSKVKRVTGGSSKGKRITCGLNTRDPPYSTINYTTVKDNNGRKALELIADKDTKNPIVQRVQLGPDECLSEIKTEHDVMEKIRKVKLIQSQKRCSELYTRDWVEYSKSDSDTYEIETTNTNNEMASHFTMMQFNVLAEGLSSGPGDKNPFTNLGASVSRHGDYGGFTDIPDKEVSLDFNLRRWRVLEVILGGGHSTPSAEKKEENQERNELSDIIIMQEVDRFYGFFEPVLKLFGYSGKFVPKFESPGIGLGWYSDGCAIFWKEDVFEFLDIETWSYGEIWTQVGLVVTLKHIITDRKVMFATTHLKSGKGGSSITIRAEQSLTLVKALQKAMAKGPEPDIPVLFSADLNADPEEDYIHNLFYHDDKPLFTSVYKVDPPKDDFFTTWKIRGEKSTRRIIDYIMYNQANAKGIQCTHILQPPKEEDIELTKLPGFRYPSDHISLGAKFTIEKKSN